MTDTTPDTRPRCQQCGGVKSSHWPHSGGISENTQGHTFEPAPDSRTVEMARTYARDRGTQGERSAAVFNAYLAGAAALQEARDEATAYRDFYERAVADSNHEAARARTAESTIAGLREQVEGLRAAAGEMFELWYDEYRWLGYGNCAHCGAAASGYMVKSVAEVECKHEPDCRVPAWAAVLAPAATRPVPPDPSAEIVAEQNEWAAPGDGALPPDARGEA